MIAQCKKITRKKEVLVLDKTGVSIDQRISAGTAKYVDLAPSDLPLDKEFVQNFHSGSISDLHNPLSDSRIAGWLSIEPVIRSKYPKSTFNDGIVDSGISSRVASASKATFEKIPDRVHYDFDVVHTPVAKIVTHVKSNNDSSSQISSSINQSEEIKIKPSVLPPKMPQFISESHVPTPAS